MRPAEEGLLLLCCKLGQAERPLSAAEYRRLRARVNAARPRGASGELTADFLAALGYSAGACDRILRLLGRRRVLHDYLSAHADVSVLTRLDERFPQRLRKLGGDCPAALFCKGDLSLLQTRCIAAVGSRALYGRGRAFAQEVGGRAAEDGFTLVSGNAAGADTAAQEACLAAGGRVICFVPDELTKYPVRENVLYCSTEGYDLPFSSARALFRNLLIHALGEKVFVVQCPAASGGTWSGTTENLRRGLSDVYVLNDGTSGANALIGRGATPVEDRLPPIAGLRPPQLSIFD